jgi:hypothetical protein
VRLLYRSNQRHGGDGEGGAGQWLHTPLGRVVAAILLSQGLAYGLQLLCMAGVLAAEETQQSVWSTVFGLVLLQAVQAMSIIAGGILAGAGQRRALVLGSFVGLINGLVYLLVQDLKGDKLTEIALYGQPLLHIGFGALGAMVGAIIWRPLPKLAMPEFDIDKKFKAARDRHSLFAALRGPIAWPRVLFGIPIVTVGFLYGPDFLTRTLEEQQHRMMVNDHLQAQLVTWEIIGLATLLGAAIAGATTRNGTKQGLCVGIGACVVLLGIYLGNTALPIDRLVHTVSCILPLTFLGGWFGGELFPPVQPLGRGRRLRAAS